MSLNGYKVLFIHPPRMGEKGVLDNLRYPPMGIATVAAAIREEAGVPLIYDANIEKGGHLENISRIIRDEEIDAAGLSFTTILARGAYALAGEIRRRFPDLVMLAGGYHPSVMPVDVVEQDLFDYVVVGEGEKTLPALLAALKDGKDPSNIIGLAFKRDGKAVSTGRPELIADIDRLPIPAYDLLSLGSYSSLSNTRSPFVTVIRSRGCPFRCVFCGVEGMFSRRFRCQSPERTLKEIRFLVEEFGVREVLFKDSDFMIKRENVMVLCGLLIEENLDLIWSCNSRVDMLDKEVLSMMYRAGCRQMTFGIESGSQRMLDSLMKDFTVEQAVKAVTAAKEAGMVCIGDFIVGAPGEDLDSINETLEFIKKIPLDLASFHYLVAFPGSPLYALSIEKGWLKDEREIRGYEAININASNLTESELEDAMKLLVRSFYLRPAFILKRLTKLSLRDIRNNFIGGMGVLKKVFNR